MPTEIWIIFVSGAATVGYLLGRAQNIDKVRTEIYKRVEEYQDRAIASWNKAEELIKRYNANSESR